MNQPPLPDTVIKTRLWRISLGSPEADSLKQAFLAMRGRVALLVGEIHRYLPDYTVHDISHLDALWETADLLAGSQLDLTPAEGFVFGGASLLHDAAMSLAAYPEGLRGIRDTAEWRDLVAVSLRRRLGRLPSEDEIKDVQGRDHDELLGVFLRDRHAGQAERLATTQWDYQGQRYFLLSEDDLRRHYGHSIGQLAHSHHWSVGKVGNAFDRILGTPGSMPAVGSVDCLKVAVLLRCADAAHLDDRRSPVFLAALRGIAGLSDEHWTFQSRMLTPIIENDHLRMNAGAPFDLGARGAWWRCYEAARMVDGELRQCDALLADRGRVRLAAHAVAGVEEPRRFAQYVRTQGWEPVETRVRVTDVPSLIERMGGQALYGDDPTVPLRELLQNAIDAVQARRIFEKRGDTWGEIVVRTGTDALGPWLEVEDSGVGMSDVVLTGPLLDFGMSYWTSPMVREEFPGLSSSGFEPIGKFGIGFFSVFMWGDRVRVTTRSCSESARSRILEFDTGLRADPALRDAHADERLVDAGTRVRVWYKNGADQISAFISVPRGMRHSGWSLAQLISWLCPASPVDILAEHHGRRSEAVHAHDWRTLNLVGLLNRVLGEWTHDDKEQGFVNALSGALRNIEDDSGALLGRMAICPPSEGFDDPQASRNISGREAGVVVTGGIRAAVVEGVVGIVHGRVLTSNRFFAWPSVPDSLLRQWSTEQANYWDRLLENPIQNFARQIVSTRVAAFGGDIGNLPIAVIDGAYTTKTALRAWAKKVKSGESVSIITSSEWGKDSLSRAPWEFSVITGAHVYGMLWTAPPLGWMSYRDAWPWTRHGERPYWDGPLEILVIKTLAEGWECSEEQLKITSHPDLFDLTMKPGRTMSIMRP